MAKRPFSQLFLNERAQERFTLHKLWTFSSELNLIKFAPLYQDSFIKVISGTLFRTVLRRRRPEDEKLRIVLKQQFRSFDDMNGKVSPSSLHSEYVPKRFSRTYKLALWRPIVADNNDYLLCLWIWAIQMRAPFCNTFQHQVSVCWRLSRVLNELACN